MMRQRRVVAALADMPRIAKIKLVAWPMGPKGPDLRHLPQGFADHWGNTIGTVPSRKYFYLCDHGRDMPCGTFCKTLYCEYWMDSAMIARVLYTKGKRTYDGADLHDLNSEHGS